MKLYLVQHGEAVSKEDNPDRPLSEKGRADVERMASFLARSTRVARVIHSGKARARETALLLSQVLGPGMVVEEAAVGIAPNDSTDALAKAVETLGDEDNADIMVVGHLPFMARMVSLLITGDEGADTVAFQPGSVACLERGEDGEWMLSWMVRPELMGG